MPVAAAFTLSTLVMLIACLNLANACSPAARSGKSPFASLGAGRRRVLGQLLTEGLLLALWATWVATAGFDVDDETAVGLYLLDASDFPRFRLCSRLAGASHPVVSQRFGYFVLRLGAAWKLARLRSTRT